MSPVTPPRKGARMAEVIAYVRDNPRCTKLAAAQHVGPFGSVRFGYEVVDRCIKSGFIAAVDAGNRYQLYYIHD